MANGHVQKCSAKVMVNIFRSEVMKLREEQKNAIQSFMLGRDTFVSLPTGIGKSLIYQLIIPLANELLIQGQTNETTNFSRQISKSPMLLVVAPLQALVSEQITSCEKLGLKAIKLECTDSEHDEKFDHFDVLFTSPETLERHYVTVRHLQDRIIGVVIDESHCVVNW